MIVVNHEKKLRFQSDNKTFVADTISVDRKTIWRWSKRYKKKNTWDDKFTVYFDEELYKTENPKT